MKINLILRPDLQIIESDDYIELISSFSQLKLPLTTLVLGFFDYIQRRNYSLYELKQLCQQVVSGEEFEEFIRTLSKEALFALLITENEKELFSLNPTKKSILFIYKNLNGILQGEANFLLTDNPYTLSTHALFRRKDNKLNLESTASYFNISCHDPEILNFIFILAKNLNKQKFLAETNYSEDKLTFLLAGFFYAQMLESDGIKVDNHLAFWEFHDLLYHDKSYFNAKDNAKLTPYTFKDTHAPAPVVKTYKAHFRALLPPSERFPKTPFVDILERRSSQRNFGKTALDLQSLSDFFYLSARIKKVKEDSLGGVSYRPSPSAGAVHGLEIYTVINNVAGLEKGIYHYHPVHHILELISLDKDVIQNIIESGQKLSQSMTEPQVYCIITARFQRYQYKFQKVSYKLMLKDVGCLHQTMHLVATFLSLKSIILGDSPFMAFNEAIKLPPLSESIVGTFALGL